MNTREIAGSLTMLFGELVDGAPPKAAYVLNPGDAGLLRSLDRLSAAEASAARDGGATIAAHVEHLRYGLSLMNRWAAGEDAWSDADWRTAWRTTAVSDGEWERLRSGLREQAHRWREVLREPREVDEVGLGAMMGSIAHLAYHLGATRQIARGARGPTAND